jgi:hypothetical protein
METKAIDAECGPCNIGLSYDDDASVELTAVRDGSSGDRAADLVGRHVAGRSLLGAYM